MDAIGLAARSIKAGEATLMIAGGVEGISRAPFVMGKAESALARNATIFDTNIGWRFVNPEMETQYDTHSMPQTADNMAASPSRAPIRMPSRYARSSAGPPPTPPVVSSTSCYQSSSRRKKATQGGLTVTNTRAPRQR